MNTDLNWGIAMRNNHVKVAVIGLDGLSWNYLNKLINHGTLPYLKHLIYTAFRTNLHAFPPSTPPSWSSIMTGVNPGKHGIFDFLYFNRNSLKVRLTSALDLEHPRIHEMLSMIGMKSIVINPVPSYPLFRISNAIQISHSFFTPKLLWSPQDAKKYASILIYEAKAPRDFYGTLENANMVLERYLDLVETLLDKEEWSLFWINLHYPDDYLHKIDSQDILKEKIYNEEVKLFKKIDKLVRILDSLSDYTVIVSDHGFSHYKYILNINSLLYKKGLVTIAKEGGLRESWELHGVNKYHNTVRISPDSLLVKIVFRTPFRRTVNVLKKLYEGVTGKRIRFKEYNVDISSSKAFLLSAYSHGIVVMDKNVVQTVCKVLSELKGIKSIYSKEEIFSGPYINRASDIFIEPDYDRGYTLGKNKITYITIREKDANNHHPMGIFILKGLEQKKLFDYIPNYVVANIILSLLDAPVSSVADGLDLVSKIVRKPIKRKDIYVTRWKILKKIASIKYGVES